MLKLVFFRVLFLPFSFVYWFLIAFSVCLNLTISRSKIPYSQSPLSKVMKTSGDEEYLTKFTEDVKTSGTLAITYSRGWNI